MASKFDRDPFDYSKEIARGGADSRWGNALAAAKTEAAKYGF